MRLNAKTRFMEANMHASELFSECHAGSLICHFVLRVKGSSC